MYLVFTPMPGAFSALRLYLRWSYVPCIYSHARCIFCFEVVPLVELCTLYLLACQVHFLLWGCTSDGVLYLVFTSMPGAFSTLRLPLVELCTLCLLPCQVHFLLSGCTSGGVMYLVFTRMPGEFSALRLYLWWSFVPSIYSHARCIFYFEVVPLVELCTLYLLPCQVHFLLWGCTSGGVMHLVFTCMLGESYCMHLRSYLLCLCDIVQALINPCLLIQFFTELKSIRHHSGLMSIVSSLVWLSRAKK